ncbi:MAG: hypothetical protein AAGC95_11315 [Pseudomonadota bacterium]
MTTMNDNTPGQKKNGPVDRVSEGNVRGSIWENESQYGLHYKTEIESVYKDDQGNYHTTNVFSRRELPQVEKVAARALERIDHMTQMNREQEREGPSRTPQRSRGVSRSR